VSQSCAISLRLKKTGTGPSDQQRRNTNNTAKRSMIRSKHLCGPSPFSFGAILLPRREYRTNHARHLAANETVPTLEAKLDRLFSFGLRTAPARFGAEDVGALISTRYKAKGFQLLERSTDLTAAL
jgi:hypothetical protein